MLALFSQLAGPAILFVILLAVFRILDLFRPKPLRLPLIRRHRLTDLAYWLLGPLVTENIGKVAIVAMVVPVALLAYGKVDPDLIQRGFGPLSRLPILLQAGLGLIVADLASYWAHRAFHRGRLWRFHAVHHSIIALDWMSALRVHPVNDVMMRMLTTLPILAFGFSPMAVGGIASMLGLLAIVVHANVDWDWGPLRSVLASPRFHRWHHSDEPQALNKNFAGMFPLWDMAFGTCYMPRGVAPRSFGTDMPVPDGVVGQMLFPFRRRKSAAAGGTAADGV